MNHEIERKNDFGKKSRSWNVNFDRAAENENMQLGRIFAGGNKQEWTNIEVCDQRLARVL